MMMRYAVESSTMAAYSLYKTNTNNYLYTDEYGRATLKSKTQKKCYAWLETNYPTHSASIENKKKMLNMFSTHSNLFNTFENIDINDFSYSLFDVIKDDDEIYVFLWNIANTTIFIMDMLEDVSKSYPLVQFAKSYSRSMNKLKKSNMEIRDEFMNNHKYIKWLGVK
ncbi:MULTISPECIES: hypothetical protein [Paenibacillus]|nr:hypothetical protein [Paenibacillus odorifer]